MENSNSAANGVEYWLQWQVLVCALIFILPTAIAIRFLRKRGDDRKDELKPSDLWAPCWKNLHPRWLLFYRAFAFAAMAFLLYQTVAAFGFFVDFCIGHGLLCSMIHARKPDESGEGDKFLKKNSEEKERKGFIKLELNHDPRPNEQLGFLENLLQIVYQTCAGAVMLTDIVFWCLLLPFMTGENFQLTLLIGCMHSVNAVFLILESALNRLWVLHACCFTWYLALALVHIPCYGLYVLLTKAKLAGLSRMFPQAFVRSN
ncbi:hypothetical protein DH2020_048128 [Rehmannia glutinosa]|uniref:Uncharacterized protein n=1 Tax=Rehmannia glutinosa TaxID=99300 RepID=A0ABR0U6N9_REHGL